MKSLPSVRGIDIEKADVSTGTVETIFGGAFGQRSLSSLACSLYAVMIDVSWVVADYLLLYWICSTGVSSAGEGGRLSDATGAWECICRHDSDGTLQRVGVSSCASSVEAKTCHQSSSTRARADIRFKTEGGRREELTPCSPCDWLFQLSNTYARRCALPQCIPGA